MKCINIINFPSNLHMPSEEYDVEYDKFYTKSSKYLNGENIIFILHRRDDTSENSFPENLDIKISDDLIDGGVAFSTSKSLKEKLKQVLMIAEVDYIFSSDSSFESIINSIQKYFPYNKAVSKGISPYRENELLFFEEYMPVITAFSLNIKVYISN